MNKCSECGSEIPNHALFCTSCGSRVNGKGNTTHFRALSLSFLCATLYLVLQVVIRILLFVPEFYLYCYGDFSTSEFFLNADINNVLLIFVNLATACILKLIFARKRTVGVHERRKCRFSVRHMLVFAVLGASLQYVLTFLTYCVPWRESTILTYSENIISATSGSLLLVILSVSVVAAVVEETVFRSIMINILGRAFNIGSCVLISAVIFGAVHMSPVAFFYATLLGAVLGGLYMKYRSVLPCVIVHMFFNLMAILLPSGSSLLLDVAMLLISAALALLSGFLIFGNANPEVDTV